MWDWSGGGPHVFACAALLPDLVTAVASFASPAPYGADGLDWFADMDQDNIDDFRLTLTDPAAARAKLSNPKISVCLPRRLHQFPDPADTLPFNERRVGLDHLVVLPGQHDRQG